jgi:AraC-like DNA-binding protein
MITHLESYPRLWGGGPVVRHTNVVRGKSSWFDHVFEYPYAMFMLGGGGRVEVAGREVEMAGAFVLLTRPGRRYRYGPSATWDEYGFCFARGAGEEALRTFPEMPWALRGRGLVEEQLAIAERLLKSPAVPGVADQVDLAARMMLTASLHGTGEDIPKGPVRRLYHAEAWLRAHFREDFDIGSVAPRFAFSEATLRRLWRRHFARPPWRYVLDLRLQEARHLLRAAPELSVGEVARACGFPDQRYFATVFRRETGESPTAFRRGSGG